MADSIFAQIGFVYSNHSLSNSNYESLKTLLIGVFCSLSAKMMQYNTDKSLNEYVDFDELIGVWQRQIDVVHLIINMQLGGVSNE